MEAAIDGIVKFMAAHSGWAFWIALVFAFAENLAFLSLLVPSTAILVAVGAFVATGELSFTPIFIGASIGAILGSTLSWFLGLIYGDYMLNFWPLNKHPDLVNSGKATFAKWGAFAIIIGHFFGPLRPVAFLLCGIALMPFWRFTIFNAVGSIGWAYVVPKTGEIGGHVVGWIWNLFTGH